MAKKQAAAKDHGVPNMPDNLPTYAHEFWPDLDAWPTQEAIKRFVRSTRNNPDARIAVFTGLRRFAAVDMSVPWAWVGTTIPVVLALFSIAAGSTWIAVVLFLVAVVVIIVLLAKMTDISGRADERRRNALGWLRAFEDAIPERRRSS